MNHHGGAKPCSSCGRYIVWLTTANGAQMPTDAFEKVQIVDVDGIVRTGWLPHWTTCTQPEKHRARGKGARAYEGDRGARAPQIVRIMSLVSQLEAFGGRLEDGSIKVDGDSVTITCPRGPAPRLANRMPQPVQRSLLEQVDEPADNSRRDLGYADGPAPCPRCGQRLEGGCPAPSCPLRAPDEDEDELAL